MKIKETRRLQTPDGHYRPFNCCPVPDVYEDLDTGESVCENCGYDWTEALDD
jgi:hypothetical protein